MLAAMPIIFFKYFILIVILESKNLKNYFVIVCILQVLKQTLANYYNGTK